MKTCSKCGLEKDKSDFHNSSQTKDGKTYLCKDCATTRAVRWVKNNPKKRSENQRKYWLGRRKEIFFYRIKKMYGISEAEYNEIITKQDGKCAICSRILLSGKNIALDHCHKTGKVRGLLCFRCNTGLAYIEDTKNLKKSLSYLKVHG